MKKKADRQKAPRRWLRKSLLLLLLLLVAGLGWLMVGVRGDWISVLVNRKVPGGVLVAFSELRYLPGDGFRLSEVSVFTDKDRVTPIFVAEELILRPAIWRRLRSGEWTGELAIAEGKVQTNLGTWADDLVTDQPLLIDGIQGEVALTSSGVSFEELEADLPNIDCLLNGEIFFPQPDVAEEERALAFLPRTSRVVAKALTFIENFEFEQAPVVEVLFLSARGEHPGPRIEISLDHRGRSLHRGFEFAEIRAGAVYEQKVFTVEHFLVRENEERYLRGNALVDFERDVFTVELENTIRRIGLEALAPFSLTKLLNWLHLRAEDRCDFRMKLGPNRFDKPGHRFRGSFDVDNGFYRDTFFPEIQLDLELNFPLLKLEGINGMIGQGKGQGPFSGDITVDFHSLYVDVDVQGSFYPDHAISMVGPITEKYLREWEFRGEAPDFQVKLIQEKAGGPLSLHLDAKGEKTLWRGTAFDLVSCELSYEDKQLAVRNARARRGRERFDGNLVFAPGFSSCTLDLSSNFHLPDVARLMGPQVMRYLQPFRFKGASELEARGTVDLTGGGGHQLEGKFEFTDLVWNWMSMNTLTGSLKLEGQTLQLPDVKAEVEGGSLHANFRSEDTFLDKARFALSLSLLNMDLYKVITKATDLEDTPYSGSLSLELNVTGKLRDAENAPRSDSFAGVGKVEIREGTLFRIPLLLGLSEILSKIVRGFGYASQSDFTADFEIGEGWMRSDELFLQGNVLSIAGPGSYRFSDQKISADLKIHLLKDGILSDALKVILWPIRKLIEVQLTGTLDNPDWQPKNLPKEIFGK